MYFYCHFVDNARKNLLRKLSSRAESESSPVRLSWRSSSSSPKPWTPILLVPCFLARFKSTTPSKSRPRHSMPLSTSLKRIKSTRLISGPKAKKLETFPNPKTTLITTKKFSNKLSTPSALTHPHPQRMSPN